MEFYNKRGEVFKINDTIYYNVVENKALNILTKKSKVKSFMIKDTDDVYVVTRAGNELCYVNINDAYHDEQYAKEVVIRWQREVLRKELQQEITSYLKNQ